MNRGSVIKNLVNFLNSKHTSETCTEFLFAPHFDGDNIRRSVYIIGLNETEVEEYRKKFQSLSDSFNVRKYFSKSPDDLNDNDLVDFADNGLSNNWRSRLIVKSDLEQISDENLEDRILVSTWRIIVNEGSPEEFYCRHDIVPMIWDPGYSVAGFPEFKNGVESSIKYINHVIDTRKVDLSFDVVKCYAKKIKDVKFVSLGDEFKAKDIVTNKAEFSKNVLKLYNDYFK